MTASETTGSTSESLVARVRSGDSDGWERFSKLYGPQVYSWSRGAGLQPNDARDVIQEVFRAVAANIDSFQHERPGDTFRGWLWTITRNKIRDHFRAGATRPAAAGGTDAYQRLQEIPESPPDEDNAETGIFAATGGLAHRTLEMIRADFEDRTWQAFLQITIDGRAPANVASDLGMSVGAVYVAKSRVLRRIREHMDELL